MANITSEAELRARAAAHYGMPLTAHMLHGTLPFYPSLPVIDSEFTPPGSPAYLNQIKALEQAHSTGKLTQSQVASMAGVPYTVRNNMSMNPITDAQVAQARIHQRRLIRTQSAPLPLGQPGLLTQPGLLLQQQEQLLKENHKLYLKQRIQNTVLQRVSSKNHMENVDEEVEARLAQVCLFPQVWLMLLSNVREASRALGLVDRFVRILLEAVCDWAVILSLYKQQLTFEQNRF